MPKDRDDQLNRGTPGGGEFSLEEILAEFGGGSARRRDEGDTVLLPVLPRREKGEDADGPGSKRDNVVAFPAGERERAGAKLREKKPRQPPRRDEPPGGAEAQLHRPVEERPIPPPGKKHRVEPGEERAGQPQAPPDVRAPSPGDKVLEFPGEEEEETFFTAKLSAIRKKADEYAEHMFEQEGVEEDPEIRRAEKYIPGVDREEEPTGPLRRERKPRRLPPPAPDLSAEELSRRYGRGLRLLRFRAVLVFLLAVPMLYLTFCHYMGAPLPGALAQSHQLQIYALAILLGAAMLLGADQIVLGLARVFRLRMGLDTLASLACIATLADALTMQRLAGREDQLPYCAVCALGLGLNMWGAYLKQRGQRQACRVAASAHEPYLVTLDEDKWNGADTYAKWSGEPAGFGSQIQADDGAQRIFQVAAPLLLIACVLFSIIASVGRQKSDYLLWCLSATLTAAATFSGTLCFGMPWNTLSQRLAKCGAALAGWDGVVGTAGSAGILLSDTDLFPPGSVALNGIKVFGDFPVEKVVGFAATLIRDSGSGLDKIFHDLLRSQGAIYRRASDFQYHEGGGVSGVIRDQTVLVGSAAFMHLCQVGLPQGLNVKNAVFCAIDGDLAGIFALNYTLHSAVRPSLTALIRNRVGPVLATRDFNLTPAMLRSRFKLPVEKMEYPEVERRVELSDPNQPHGEVLSAVLCREGLFPFSEAVVGGRRLRLAVRVSSALAAVGGAVGALLAFYLTFVEAFASLSPANLLIFLIMWVVPTLLISGWVNRY